MLNKEFFEEYPLYRKLNCIIPKNTFEIPKINVNMYCENCKEIRTFSLLTNYNRDIYSFLIEENDVYISRKLTEPKSTEDIKIILLIYLCASCEQFNRYFLIKIDENLKYIQKIGQFPSWDITIEKELKQILGDYEDFYKKGLICESQSNGIGAYAYYRRIIESIIDDILDRISELITGKEKIEYEQKLLETKKSKNAKKKIELIKNLIPNIFEMEGSNPFKTLHEVLSVGIHKRTDEECLNDAKIIREILEYIVKQTIRNKEEKIKFTESMKKLLAKKKESQK